MSTVCCIYHRPKRFDESSDEDSSDSGSESDSSCNHDHAPHSHPRRPHGGARGPPPTRDEQGAGIIDYGRNAYETVPSSKKGKKRAT